MVIPADEKALSLETDDAMIGRLTIGSLMWEMPM